MKKHLLLLFAALLPLVASAEKVEIDGIWYNLVSKVKQAEVTFKGESYSSYDDEYTGSITIPATVTYEGVTYSVTSIGEWAFDSCDGLTAISLPEGLTSIGNYAFEECSSLTAINIPKDVTSIGDRAFSGCRSLTSITLPEGVTSIGYSAFHYCRSLTAITLPEGVTSIGDGAFYNCISLKSITLPEGVTSIGYRAFYNCISLKSITLPENSKLTSIGWQAFEGCSSLTDIVLPKSRISIGSKAFANCSELTDVYCNAETVPSTETDAFEGSYIEYATLHVPASAIDYYKRRAPWSDFGNIVSLDAAITRITLSESSATLTEGETLVLTMTTTPEDADRNLISWSSSNASIATVDNTGKVTAIAPGTAIITAMANDGSGVSASCEVTVNELILGTCATPTISYVDGKVVFACDTEGATVKSNIKENIAGSYNDMEVAFIPTYTITAYATKAQYENSDEVPLTLCWVPCKENHGDDNGILTIPSHPVLISTQGGTITLSGLAEGTEIAVYTTAGTEVATATATNGTATLTTGLEAGSIAIVKIGNYSIKVAIK